jgi:hypothetical protein
MFAEHDSSRPEVRLNHPYILQLLLLHHLGLPTQDRQRILQAKEMEE